MLSIFKFIPVNSPQRLIRYNHHIYNSEILSVTENCHGDEGCPRADCINGVNSVVTIVCVMYDMYSDQ